MALSKQDIVKRNWKSIQTDRGNAIFKLIFTTPLSQEKIQEKLRQEYKKKGRRTDDQILANLTSNYLNAWEELKYVEKRRQKNPESKSKYHPNINVYSANPTPFFDFCEKDKKIKFSNKQRRVLWNLLTAEDVAPSTTYFPIKDKVLSDYPKEDIINAILRFYVKDFILKYNMGYIFVEENKERFEEKYKKGLDKKRLKETKRIMEKLGMKYIDESKNRFLYFLKCASLQQAINEELEDYDTGDLAFRLYIDSKRDNPKEIKEIDKKILKASGLYPKFYDTLF